MQTMLALAAAKQEIHLIGDGSFQETVCADSWAFVVPDLGLRNAGSASGDAVDYFETLALLSGLSAIHRIDRTTRAGCHRHGFPVRSSPAELRGR